MIAESRKDVPDELAKRNFVDEMDISGREYFREQVLDSKQPGAACSRQDLQKKQGNLVNVVSRTSSIQCGTCCRLAMAEQCMVLTRSTV